MEKYKNKYRIASARAQWWDYSWASSVDLGAFVVMPNHIHGILILNRADNGNRVELVGEFAGESAGEIAETGACSVCTAAARIRIPIPTKYWEKFGIIHYWIIQIWSYETCQSIGIRQWLANPFSRSHHQK